MRNIGRICLLLLLASPALAQQQDSVQLQQDAIYFRPFIQNSSNNTALGGYVEANSNYFVEDGITDGVSFEMRRFNLFTFSQIAPRIQFLSELEFEHGTEEIALETAQLDFQVNSALNFRGGIILPTLGLVNTNHDSPNWEFIDRPLSSTELIPSTLSEVGFGIFGKFFPTEKTVISYNLYAVNGLQDGIILNESGRTHLEGGKNPDFFGSDNNGSPSWNGRLGFAHRSWGEIGVSAYSGIYNTFRLEGELIDSKRRLNILTYDFQFQLKALQVKGEWVKVQLDVPSSISEIYGSNQAGGFVDFIFPVKKGGFWKFPKAQLFVALRVEKADFNQGEFKTNVVGPIGDEQEGFALGLSFRPVPGTVIRANYLRHAITDMLGNPPAQRGGFQIGFASYF